MNTNPNLTLTQESRPDHDEIDPNKRQAEATIPHHDVWVAASAGSGKTTVLTNRVLRLLLPDPEGKWEGSAPHRILCITFTKAAAALMAIRIQKRLGSWTMMKEADLVNDLEKLTGSSATPEMITAARQLFSKVLDVPGGLAIMTIHSFCQSTLARFPLEAGLTPGFRILDESPARELLSQSIMSMVWDIECGKASHLEQSFNRIALTTDLDRLKSTLLGLRDKAEKLKNFIKKYGEGPQLRSSLLALLGLDPDDTSEKAIEQFITSRPAESLKQLSASLTNGKTKTNKKLGQELADWLALPAILRARRLDEYRLIFFKVSDGLLRTLPEKFDETHPHEYQIFVRESETVTTFFEQLSTIEQVEQTVDFLTITLEALRRYEAQKRRQNALDYGDLITKTRKLLMEKGQEWVHFKLDEGIDHILVDEAQDTNQHQWDIIKYLSDEFLSGWGKDNKSPRSLFVVGDRKQSIFSFHGADPEAFNRMRDYFSKRSKDAGRIFKPVSLDTSFRTTIPILNLVDEVFAPSELAKNLGLEGEDILTHHASRKEDAGLIELWDVLETEKKDKNTTSEWVLPFSTQKEKKPDVQEENLAVRIAHKIRQMVKGGEILESENRPIRPRDILVLVRTRKGNFVPDLIRQLKLLEIEVSGIDRMKLRDQIAVEDCLALARFARLPQDDFSLACVLKSPFIRIEEQTLMDLSIHRTKDQTLWDMVQLNLPEEISAWLSQKIEQATKLSPFNFFDETLCCSCPKDRQGSARRSFATILGPDCLDPLDEFLGFCLSAEQDGVYGLEDLITRLEKDDIEIKREMEDTEKESGDQVRIMTVHASKGLEAPILFLPDTISTPAGKNIGSLLWHENTQNDDEDVPLWATTTRNTCAQYKQAREHIKNKEYAEYLRLLYVALTRPRDRLYICGKAGSKGLSDKNKNLNWYQLVKNAFDRMEIDYSTPTTRTYKSLQCKPVAIKPRPSENRKQIEAVNWLHYPPEPETDARHYVHPSLIGRHFDPSLSPLQNADAHRFERGILTHRLFEFLPDIAPAHREQAARKFLDKNGHALPEDIRVNILTEVLDILDDPVFASVFGTNSLAEVPLTGEIEPGRILSGQIDRLVVEKDRILIVDFKTNRPSPKSEADIPQEYKDQLRAYKHAISMVYPGKPIHCALLWTDRALLMPIEI
ncbi:MAG: double-strand break repair helicase AddA [Alphaproteobacteria bacterium]|nr:double-strand break repair helicase AddA [Alphaproteobacteria bacterium]